MSAVVWWLTRRQSSLRELVSGIRSLKLTDEATQRTRLEVEVFSAFAAAQSFIRIV